MKCEYNTSDFVYEKKLTLMILKFPLLLQDSLTVCFCKKKKKHSLHVRVKTKTESRTTENGNK